jgi:hypothetical protein
MLVSCTILVYMYELRGIRMSGKARRVREQAVVYLGEGDRELLERLAAETGLSRTELFRRGLRRLAGELLETGKPGASLDYLVETAGDSDFPADVAERHDAYLHGGGYARHIGRKRARPD